jgi:methyl-accepting chemotaxis protein
MEINMMEAGFALQSYLVDSDPTHLDRIKDAEEDFDRFFKEYQRLAETEKGKEMGTKLGSIYDAFKEKIAALLNSEDSQDQKIVTLLENYKKIDDILDDSIQISIRRNDPQRYEKTRTSMEMEININGIAKGLGNYLRTRQAQYEDRVTEDESEFKQALREYEGLTLSTQERQWARQVRSVFEETAKIAGEIIKLDKEITIDETEYVKLRRDMDVLMDDEIQAQADKDLIAEEEEARASITTANILTLVLLLGGIIIGGIAATVITRGITNPLRIVVNRVDEIAGAAGDLTAKVPEASKDESGDLAKAFNKMLGGLKGIVIKVVGSSQSITASSQQLSASSQQTNASVQQVSSTIQQLAKGAQTQAQMVEDTIKIMEERFCSGRRRGAEAR